MFLFFPSLSHQHDKSYVEQGCLDKPGPHLGAITLPTAAGTTSFYSSRRSRRTSLIPILIFHLFSRQRHVFAMRFTGTGHTVEFQDTSQWRNDTMAKNYIAVILANLFLEGGVILAKNISPPQKKLM